MELDLRALGLAADATRAALAHLREFFGRVQQGLCHEPKGLGRQFSAVRRLDAHLRRLHDGGQRELDLDEDGRNLLAACLVHHAGDLERRVLAGEFPPDQADWYREKVLLLVQLAEKLHTRHIQPIVHPDPFSVRTPSVRRFFFEQKGDRALEAYGTIRMAPDPGPRPAARAAAEEPRLATEEGGPPAAGEQSAGGGRDEPAPAAQATEPAVAEVPAEVRLLVPELIRDHRVRAQSRVDLAGYRRAKNCDDRRLILVHLGSLLEAVLLDHALERRAEYGLREAPNRWNFVDLARKVLGDRIDAAKEPVLSLLLAARRLLSPAVMLVHPVVVTETMVDEAEAFLRWVLNELGYRGRCEGGGAPADRAEPPRLSGIWKAARRVQEA